MPNLIDRAIAYIAPSAAVRRAHARRALSYYEAARPDRLRKGRRETGSGNDAVLRAGSSLRQQARHLEQNYDIARGVLNVLVANTVGASGIGVEPQPRRKDGSIHAEFARELLDLYKDWSLKPEVTWRHDWAGAQRLLARAWFRDGEVFAQTLEGLVAHLDHGTRVPLSIEMLEADYVPMELQSETPTIRQGIEINAWGRPVAVHVWRDHPLEAGGNLSARGQTKRLPAERVLHAAQVDRIRQLRGVSVFASVLTRFDDLKDYEESERIAAKVAASMAAFIKKGNPDTYEPQTDADLRTLKFRPGMIFDDLKPGEDVGTIDTNRPNPNLENYRSGQIKAVAAGTGPTYSSVAKTYDGTYSAQRQELVEGWVFYQTLSSEFTSRIVRPVYEKFVALALASGAVRRPADVVPESLDDAIYITPQMPWIDPKKEAEAWGVLEDRAYISGPEIIRKRGGNPLDVLDQQQRWREEKDKRGIPQDASVPPAPEPAPEDDVDDEEEGAAERIGKALAAPLAAMAAATQAVMAKEVPAPVINFTSGPVNVTSPEIHNHLPAADAPEVHAHFEATLPEQPAPEVHAHFEASLPEQPAPEVHVHNTVQAAPVSKVEITAMPPRETTTTVERDKRENIVTTKQTEKDA